MAKSGESHPVFPRAHTHDTGTRYRNKFLLRSSVHWNAKRGWPKKKKATTKTWNTLDPWRKSLSPEKTAFPLGLLARPPHSKLRQGNRPMIHLGNDLLGVYGGIYLAEHDNEGGLLVWGLPGATSGHQEAEAEAEARAGSGSRPPPQTDPQGG